MAKRVTPWTVVCVDEARHEDRLLRPNFCARQETRVKKGRLPDGTVLENTLDCQFEQPKPRTAFVTDVTYIPVKEGCLYVSSVMDLCMREIVVCEMSTRQD